MISAANVKTLNQHPTRRGSQGHVLHGGGTNLLKIVTRLHFPLIYALFLLLVTPTLSHAAMSVMWIMDQKPVPQVVKDKLEDEKVEWVVLRRAAGKMCIDAVLPDRQTVNRLKNYLVANDFNPLLVGAWNYDGTMDDSAEPVVFNEARFLSCMPDICIGDPPVCERPMIPKERHKFAGWPWRIIP